MPSLSSQLLQLCWREAPERAVRIYQKHAAELTTVWEKQGESPTLRRLFEWINLAKGTYPGGIPNHPGPLTSMLVGGLAGAGLGYGLGALGEHVLPDSWGSGRLRRTAALLGGLAGVSPGATWAGANAAHGHDWNDSSTLQDVPKPTEEWIGVDPRLLQFQPAPDEKTAAAIDRDVAAVFNKYGFQSLTGLGTSSIPVDSFNRIIWNDPRVAGPLSPNMQAAATGLVTGAANLPGKHNTQFVTPMDVGRMAAGMGSGYLSGMLVGKALGVMMGMPEQTQDKLKNTGMFAGLVANLVPIAFGR